MKEMQAVYERDPDRYISADNSGKLAAGAHPCSFYNKMKNSPGSLETRVEKTDTQGTNYRRRFPGHENDECKYNAGMFDTTSPAFRAAKAAARASSSLGGTNAGRMKTESKDFINWLMQDGLCQDKEEAMAMLAIESEKHHSGYRGCFNKDRWDDAFQARLDALVAYKQEHGSFASMRSNDKKLMQFCSDMRHARKNPDSGYVLDESRIDALDAIGFDWNPRAKKTAATTSAVVSASKRQKTTSTAAIVTSGSDESSLDIDDSAPSDGDMMLVESADEARLSYEESVKRGLGLMRPMPTPPPKPNLPPEGFHIAPCFCENTGCQNCYDYQEQFRSKENPRKMIGGSTDRRNAAIAVGAAVGVAVVSSAAASLGTRA